LAKTRRRSLKRDEFSSRFSFLFLRMISSENRWTFFRIMCAAAAFVSGKIDARNGK
jgi:hypothetical protein